MQIKEELKKYDDSINNLKFDELREELSDGIKIQIDFITKTPEDTNYICTECGQIFIHMHSYKAHTYVCQQISNKYKSLVQLNIDLICQVKQLLNICKMKEINKTTNNKTNENLIKELTDYNIKLKSKYKASKKKYEDLENKYNMIENQRTIFEAKCNMFETNIIQSQIKYNNLKDKYNKIKMQREKDIENKLDELKFKAENPNINSIFNGNCNFSNNNNNVTIILNNNPPFEYVNPFIDASTEMPYNYKNPEEMRVLLDNKNQSTEIKAKLCNGIAFYISYNDKELYDFVATCITVAYQKEDPKQRSIVNTDTTRNSFHVRLTDKTGQVNYWYYDKMGEKLKLLLFKPTREYMIEAVRSFVYYCAQKFLSNKEEFTYPYTVEDHKIYRDFVNGNSELFNDDPITYKKYKQLFATLDDIQGVVRDTNFNSEILGKISKKFFLDKKQHKLINGKNILTT